MNVQNILDRILSTVDRESYLTPYDHVEERFREPLAAVQRMLADESVSAPTIRSLVLSMHAEGKLDQIHLHSALHVVAAHPRVKDYVEAARQIAEQEMAIYALGPKNQPHQLASVDRHRGVLAYLQGQYAVSLDYLTRAMERERSVENLGNVLCALIRLGSEDEAREILVQARKNLPDSFVTGLDRRIQDDPDLLNLKMEAL
ncbi:MAG: hypothetical protein AB8H79_25115 [Myxococcota bacterium]